MSDKALSEPMPVKTGDQKCLWPKNPQGQPAQHKPSHVGLPSPEAASVTTRPYTPTKPPTNDKRRFHISASINSAADFRNMVTKHRNLMDGRFELLANDKFTGIRLDDPQIAMGLMSAANRLCIDSAEWKVADLQQIEE